MNIQTTIDFWVQDGIWFKPKAQIESFRNLYAPNLPLLIDQQPVSWDGLQKWLNKTSKKIKFANITLPTESIEFGYNDVYLENTSGEFSFSKIGNLIINGTCNHNQTVKCTKVYYPEFTNFGSKLPVIGIPNTHLVFGSYNRKPFLNCGKISANNLRISGMPEVDLAGIQRVGHISSLSIAGKLVNCFYLIVSNIDSIQWDTSLNEQETNDYLNAINTYKSNCGKSGWPALLDFGHKYPQFYGLLK